MDIKKIKKMSIIYNKLSENAKEDEKDVIEQIKLIKENSKDINISEYALEEDFTEMAEYLKKENPDVVFNMVESIKNKGRYIYLSPAFFEMWKIKYTGADSESMFLCQNKYITKQIMQRYNIRTPKFYNISDIDKIKYNKKYISKPIWEDGSLGIGEENVFEKKDKEKLKKIKRKIIEEYFIEEYIDGREFNIAIMGEIENPIIMSPAEIIFKNYKKNKPKILDYKAKWEEDSFEYKNTIRSFEIEEKIVKKIKKTALKCWRKFKLKGYARIDFRYDGEKIYVLEINPNPCISEDSGFMAAAKHDGYTEKDVIEYILKGV